MVVTNARLTAAIKAHFADLARMCASGGATEERSSSGPLAGAAFFGALREQSRPAATDAASVR